MLEGAKRVFQIYSNRPGLFIAIVLLFGAGGAVNGTFFNIMQRTVWNELPYPNSDRIAYLWNTYPKLGVVRAGTSIPDYIDRLEFLGDEFSHQALHAYVDLNVFYGGRAFLASGVKSTPQIFGVGSTSPSLGRVFRPEEAAAGAEDVVVLSRALWEKLGSDPAILGETLLLGGQQHVVIGVMPAGFTLPGPNVEFWVPLVIRESQKSDTERGSESHHMIGRLYPSSSTEKAQEAVDRLNMLNMERMPERVNFWESAGFGTKVASYHEKWFGDIRVRLFLGQAIGVLAFMIAGLNVAGLLMIRVGGSANEFRLRAACGASPFRMGSMILVEAALLGTAGGALGFAGAVMGAGLLDSLLGQLPYAPEAYWEVAIFCLLVTIAFAFMMAIIPIRMISGQQLSTSSGQRGIETSTSYFRAAASVLQVALCTVIITLVVLVVSSYSKFARTDFGFETPGILMAKLAIDDIAYPSRAKVTRFLEEVKRTINAQSGIMSVGLADQIAFGSSSFSSSYDVESLDWGGVESRPVAYIRSVDEHFFAVAGIEILEGRGFTQEDQETMAPVAVVDARFRSKFPQLSIVGAQLIDLQTERVFTVVGVAENVITEGVESEYGRETIYRPLGYSGTREAVLLAKTNLDPTGFASILANVVSGIDPKQPIYDVLSLRDHLRAGVAPHRDPMIAMVAFGVIAAFLSAAGIYSSTMSGVGARRTELAIRMAVGAAPDRIFLEICWDGAKLLLSGILLGALLLFAAQPVIGPLIAGASHFDPPTFFLAVAITSAIVAAAVLPVAARNAKLDVASHLRWE